MAGLLSRSEQFDSGDRGRLTRRPVTTAVVSASHLDVIPAHHLVVDFLLFRSARLTTCSNVLRRTTGRKISGSVLLFINNRCWISMGVITVLGEFSSWDRAHAQRTCRRVVGRPRRVGTSSFCRVIRSIVDVPCTRISCGPLLSRAARCAASRSARSEEKPSPLFTLAPLWGTSRPRKGGQFPGSRGVSSLFVVAAGCRLGSEIS
uniref:Uncharacterized protein n=1 Tax=Hyaloperonospora arabidopsidis (strain Emoy2) TaxID=559515 RepID=M4C1P9_HYAAE